MDYLYLFIKFFSLCQIFDPANARFEVPIETSKSSSKPTVTDYLIFIKKNPFSIAIKRLSTGAIL